MKKYIILFILIFYGIQLFAQKRVIADGIEYEVFIPSQTLKSKISNSLNVRNSLLKLKIHPQLNLTNEQLSNYSLLIDTLVYLDNSVYFQNLSIRLINGLTWNLESKPDFLSKEFYRKVKRKKYWNDKDVISGLKYLQFCDMWINKDEMPYFMVDKFIYYESIDIDGINYLKIYYELKFKPDGKGTYFSNKQIKIISYH